MVDEAGTTSENTGINVETETIELIPEAKDVIPYYFGEDSEVEEVTIEGKKYYLVIYSYDTPCSYNEERSKNPTISSETTSLEAENTKTLFFKDLYETDTYSLVKQEVYLASISDNNLISSSEYVVEKAEKTISEVSSLFTFDLNVNVKNVPTTAYNENSYYPYEKDVIKQSSYLTYLKNFLQQKDIEIFTPSNETYVLFETSISDYYDPTKPYYTNRNFYPNNDFGQKQYEDYLALYESLSYNQKFTTTYILKDETERSQDPGFYQISAYDKNLDVSDFSEYFFGTNQYTFKDSISLKINNETVSATKYTYNYQAGVEDFEGKEISPDYAQDSYNNLIIFDYESYKYVINIFTYDTNASINSIFSDLKGYHPDNDWNEIEAKVKGSFSLHEDFYGKIEPQDIPSSNGSGTETYVVEPDSNLETIEINP